MKSKFLLALFVFVTCFAVTFDCQGQGAFTFQVMQPTSNQIVWTNFNVQVAVQSTYQLQGVTATIDGRTSNLVFSASTWNGTISLAGTTSGQKTLTILASDVFGGIGQTQVVILKDLPPTITVLEPATGTVARPTVHVVAQGADDGPAGAIVNVFAGTNLVASGTNNVDAFVNILDSEGQPVSLTFTAVDSIGQSISAYRTVYVFTDTNWLQAAVVEGPILDVSPNTILFVDDNKLMTKSRQTGVETVLLDNTNITPAAGFLTPSGAIFITAPDTNFYTYIYDLHDGTLTNVDSGGSVQYFQIQGDFVSWNYGYKVILYSVSAQTNVVVSTAGYPSCLASNGDVIYVVQGIKYLSNELWRFRNGTNTELAFGSYFYYYLAPSTDGTNVVYGKVPYPTGPSTPSVVALNDGATETLLGTNYGGRSYQMVNNGWVAYTDLGTGDIRQIWTRSPAGTGAQQSFFGTDSSIVVLAPNGQIIFGNGGHLYLPNQGSLPKDLGAWNFGAAGKVFWQQGLWYAQIGSSLFVLSQPAAIRCSGFATSEGATLVVQGNAGDTVICQRSSNLIDWFSFSTNMLTGSSIQVKDPQSVGAPFTFYRAFLPTQ